MLRSRKPTLIFACRYKLAEKLSDRLNDMGKDLTSMIEEINDASARLSKSSKADDPVGHALPRWINQTANCQLKIAFPNRSRAQWSSVPASTD